MAWLDGLSGRDWLPRGTEFAMLKWTMLASVVVVLATVTDLATGVCNNLKCEYRTADCEWTGVDLSCEDQSPTCGERSKCNSEYTQWYEVDCVTCTLGCPFNHCRIGGPDGIEGQSVQLECQYGLCVTTGTFYQTGIFGCKDEWCW